MSAYPSTRVKTWKGVSGRVVVMGVGGSIGGRTASKPASAPCSMVGLRIVLADSHELVSGCGGVYKLFIFRSM